MSRGLVVRAQIQVSRCTRCPLAGANVPMVAPADPVFTVIGGRPQPRDFRNQEPFTSPAGRSIRKLFAKAGLDPESGAWMNVVGCGGDAPSAFGACHPNRQAQLAAGSDWVLAMGPEALKVWRTDVPLEACWGVPMIRGDRVVVPCPELAAPGYDWKIDKTVRRFVGLVVGGRELAGEWPFGEWCLKCRRPAEVWDRDMWPWCAKHRPGELTAKQREKKMKTARTRANERKQEVMF